MKATVYILLFFNSISFSFSQQLLAANADSLIQKTMMIKQANKEQAAKQTITHFVMKNADNTYGYSIFIDGNMAFHQPNIPAISGVKGFEQAEHADKVAKLAIQKINEGESPPTVTIEEVGLIIKSKK